MQAAIAPDILDFLLDLPIGQPVALYCRTSEANICLKKDTGDGRKRVVPEAIHLRAIPRTETGIYQGLESGNESGITYAVLTTCGECSIISPKGKVIGTETRQKQVHVPIGAIKRVIQH